MDKSIEAARFKTTVAQSPAGCIVYVPKKYARHAAQPPSDGRTYIVQDPVRPKIWHWTFPDGRYETHDELGPINAPACNLMGVREKRVLSNKKKKPQKFRLVRISSCRVVRGDIDQPPTISLIGLERVERITGFKKSFIYAREDFPKRVNLGDQQSDSVRWVESEVIEWVMQLVAKRQTGVPTN